MMVFKFELLNFLFSLKLINSRPCRDLNPGTPVFLGASRRLLTRRSKVQILIDHSSFVKKNNFKFYSKGMGGHDYMVPMDQLGDVRPGCVLYASCRM